MVLSALGKKLSGLDLSASTLERVTEQIGRRIKKEQKAEVESALSQGVKAERKVKLLHVAADETTVRTESGWKEVKSGAIYEAKVKRGKEPRACRISYVSTFEKAPEFGKELWTEAARRGASDAERVVTLGDGSTWIWNLYAEHFPNRVEILDYYHASEHLGAVARANWGETSQEASNWHKKQAKRLLKRDGVKKVLEDLKGLQSKVVEAQKVIDDNILYFENNLDRMNYYEYRKAGYKGQRLGRISLQTPCGWQTLA